MKMAMKKNSFSWPFWILVWSQDYAMLIKNHIRTIRKTTMSSSELVYQGGLSDASLAADQHYVTLVCHYFLQYSFELI